MENKNNYKIICYLDGGDVCGFVIGGIGSGIVVGSGSGGGGRDLVDHLMEILIPRPFQPPPP